MKGMESWNRGQVAFGCIILGALPTCPLLEDSPPTPSHSFLTCPRSKRLPRCFAACPAFGASTGDRSLSSGQGAGCANPGQSAFSCSGQMAVTHSLFLFFVGGPCTLPYVLSALWNLICKHWS